MLKFIEVPHLGISYLDPDSLDIQDIQNIYLDWRNNFLTPAKFAEHYRLTMPQAEELILEGRMLQDRYAALIKELKARHNLDDLANNQ